MSNLINKISKNKKNLIKDKNISQNMQFSSSFENNNLNLSQLNKQQQAAKHNFKNYKYKKSNNDDDLLIQAFDPDEKFDLPDDYILDEMNDQSIQFLKKSKDEEIQENSTRIKNQFGNKYRNIIDKDEITFNINVNNDKEYLKNYHLFNIGEDWKNIVLHEFKYMNSFFNDAKEKRIYSDEQIIADEQTKDYNNFIHLQNLKKEYITHDDVIKEFRLYKENSNKIQPPSSDNISLFLALKLKNKNIIKLIKHLNKNIDEGSNMNNILMWVYMFLSFIQLPLIDDDNSILYMLNKTLKVYLFSKIIKDGKEIISTDENDLQNLESNELIASKIIFIIISEFFNQKIL